MSDTHSIGPGAARRLAGPAARAVLCLVLLIAGALLVRGPLAHVPGWLVLPVADRIGGWLNWFARDAALGPLRVADISRALAAAAQEPIRLLQMVLADGWAKGAGFNRVQILPPLSWLGITLGAALLGLRLSGPRLGLLTLASGAYLAVFGLWTSAMTTLASVLICVAVAMAAGLAIGIRTHRSPRAEPAVRAVLNVMQTVPVFSYLLPTLLLFGYGPSAALFATVVYALPPMVHATALALRAVPPETLELAAMAGCSRRQRLWKVELPVAMPRLAIGLNQVVMMTLNMVIIASMIGAGGLGYDVLRALRRLDFGGGFEAGMGIVVLAVVLDRITQAAALSRAQGRRNLWRGRDSALALALLLVPTLASLALPALAVWPQGLTLTTAPFWNGLVSFINLHFFDTLDAMRTGLLLDVMNPLRDALLALPWSVAVVALALAGWALGGGRLAVLLAGFAMFVVVTGYWADAMGSLYLIALSTVVALAIGLPFGIWVAARPALRGGVELVLDTLQTLPTLVYLLPAVMLFRNGDVSALIAIVSYAVAPAVRYGIAGMAHVPHERLEAAAMCGCSRWQTFVHVRLPAALPTLLLGVNQTIMMALSMLVIAALVGTRELGQTVFTALSRGETGVGIVAGLCVACIALSADALLKAGAARTARHQGEAHA